jgi:hypothetical protein
VSTTAKEAAHAGSDYRVPAKSAWAGAWKVAAGIGVVGLAIGGFGYKTDPARFPFSYLFAYFVALSLALGSLFFVLIQYVTKAAWGLTSRRVAEFFMRPLGLVFPILAIPLVLLMPQLFPWMGAKHAVEAGQETTSAEHASHEAKPASPLEEERGLAMREPAAMRDPPVPNAKAMEQAEEGAEQKIVDHKRAFLNRNLVVIRLFAFLLVWFWLSDRYFRWSTEQDKTKSLEATLAAQRFAPAGLMLFAVTITLFAFDWLLSLNATWYSTIFGVYVFAQMALFNMASIILATMLLRRSGLLGDAVNVEHYHDMGKMLLGWIAFWSYIAFAQFFLTWYSNIPDELSWFQARWRDNGGTWQGTSIALVVMHFFVPFWFLMSRNIKRRLPLLAVGAICMVIMHVVEVYWVVMPNFGPLEPNITDVGCLLGVFGVYLAAVLYGLRDHALIPVGDPRLERALEFENA